MTIESIFAPRFNYAREETSLEIKDSVVTVPATRSHFLGIRNSVKELTWFFRRVQYRVNGMYFGPDDIEHGILRSNQRLPHSVYKSFGRSDSRLRFVTEDLEPAFL